MTTPTTGPKSKPYYVSNIELFKQYTIWYEQIAAAEAEGKEAPEMPRYVAEAIQKICTKLAFRPNFINYSYREEMIGDAIENNIKSAKNFKLDRSSNPFSFITTIAWHAFLRRIEVEKKQTYIKSKIIEEMPIEELIGMQDHDEDTMVQHSQFLEYMRENSYIAGAHIQERKQSVTLDELEALEVFMEEEPK